MTNDNTNDATDAMAELSLALQHGGTLAWVLRYHRDGAPDPVQAAWARCQSGAPMREVLERVAPSAIGQAEPVMLAHWRTEDHAIGDLDACCANAMRIAAPAGITLDAVLASLTPH
jgi:hypothetical protein